MTMPARATEIVTAVASAHRVSLGRLFGPSRTRDIVWPRQEAWAKLYALRSAHATQHALYSLPQIAGWFDRDHTTVLHGIRAHWKRQAEGQP